LLHRRRPHKLRTDQVAAISSAGHFPQAQNKITNGKKENGKLLDEVQGRRFFLDISGLRGEGIKNNR